MKNQCKGPPFLVSEEWGITHNWYLLCDEITKTVEFCWGSLQAIKFGLPGCLTKMLSLENSGKIKLVPLISSIRVLFWLQLISLPYVLSSFYQQWVVGCALMVSQQERVALKVIPITYCPLILNPHQSTFEQAGKWRVGVHLELFRLVELWFYLHRILHMSGSWGSVSSLSSSSRFSFILLFWYQILMCFSVRFKALASSILLARDM